MIVKHFFFFLFRHRSPVCFVFDNIAHSSSSVVFSVIQDAALRCFLYCLYFEAGFLCSSGRPTIAVYSPDLYSTTPGCDW